MALPSPPPGPVCVLRGHGCDAQAVAFLPLPAALPGEDDDEGDECGGAAAAPSPGGSLLLSGDADGRARLWRTSTRRAVAEWRAHPASAGVLAVGHLPAPAPGGLLTQGRDGALRLWQARAAAGRRARRLQRGGRRLTRVSPTLVLLP